MTIKLNAATGGGSVSLSAPNSTTSNADVTLTLPPNDGDASQYLQTDGAGALSWQTVTDTNTGGWTELTSSSVSGASTTITGIPSTAVAVRVVFQGIAGNGDWGFRVGTSSGLASTGYVAFAGLWGNTSLGGNLFTNEWRVESASTVPFGGQINIVKRDGNNWQGWGNAFRDDGTNNTSMREFAGRVALGGALDRVGVSALGATFSAGDIYVWYQEA